MQLKLALPLMVACAVGSAPATEPDREEPVPIYQPSPETPLETAGTGLAPLVTVQFQVDSSGRVRALEMTSVQPSSAFDDLFRAAAQRALSQWRFLPAIRDGTAVESELTLLFRFPAREVSAQPGGPGLGMGLLDLLAAGEDTRDHSRRKIIALPEKQRQAMLQEITEKAHAALAEGTSFEASSDVFHVVTDGPPEVAQAVLVNLELTYYYLSALLVAKIPPRHAPGKLEAYVYRAKSGYDNLVQSVEGYEWAAGFYHPAGFLAFHLNHPTSGHLNALLIHETVHAFLDRYIVRPGVALPIWLDEGFSEYVGNSDIRKGKLVPGGKRQKFVWTRTRTGAARFDTTSHASAIEVKEAVRKGKALSITELLATSRSSFYGEKRRLFYPQAWMLVHFLLHGKEGWSDEAFPRFLLYVAEGFTPDVALEDVYGAPPAHFEEAYRRHIRKF